MSVEQRSTGTRAKGVSKRRTFDGMTVKMEPIPFLCRAGSVSVAMRFVYIVKMRNEPVVMYELVD